MTTTTMEGNHVTITINQLEIEGNTLVKILRLLKTHEPEIYESIKTALLPKVMAKIIHNTSNRPDGE